MFKDTAALILATDLLEADLSKISSWGRIGDRLVLRDQGLDISGWNANYKDSGEAKSSSRSKSTHHLHNFKETISHGSVWQEKRYPLELLNMR